MARTLLNVWALCWMLTFNAAGMKMQGCHVEESRHMNSPNTSVYVKALSKPASSKTPPLLTAKLFIVVAFRCTSRFACAFL